MITWIQSQLSTIFVLLALAGVVTAIVRYLVREKKQGKCACGCSCEGGCAGCSACHHK